MHSDFLFDWSQVPDEDLKLQEISQEEGVKRFIDPYRRFEKMVVAAICIEQAKRKTYASWDRYIDENFQPNQEDQRKTNLDLLNEHRQLRSSKGISAGKHVWTHSSDGRFITEYRNYWAVVDKAGDKFCFFVHDKGKSGYDIVCASFERATEADARQGASDSL